MVTAYQGTVDKERELHQIAGVIWFVPNRQNKVCLYETYHYCHFWVLHWIKKQNTRRYLLEHLESSGIKIMMSRPIVCEL